MVSVLYGQSTSNLYLHETCLQCCCTLTSIPQNVEMCFTLFLKVYLFLLCTTSFLFYRRRLLGFLFTKTMYVMFNIGNFEPISLLVLLYIFFSDVSCHMPFVVIYPLGLFPPDIFIVKLHLLTLPAVLHYQLFRSCLKLRALPDTLF